MPESGSTDPEISGLLRHFLHTPKAPRAFEALQQYRADALGPLPDGLTRSQAFEQAREELRSRLLHLLVDGDTVGPAVEYVVNWAVVLREQAGQEQAVRHRADDVYNELFRRELRVLDLDNFPAGNVALLAAQNNLALRRLALEEPGSIQFSTCPPYLVTPRLAGSASGVGSG